MESFNESEFKRITELDIKFIQDNESRSTYGVLRGLHYQKPPFAQSKLVRVISGSVLDIAVDLRQNSPTYGRWESVELSEENKLQFFIPKGFAHGFLVLSESAIFSYKVDNYYNGLSDAGIFYKDQGLKIDWQIDESKLVLSDKDMTNSSFSNYSQNPIF